MCTGGVGLAKGEGGEGESRMMLSFEALDASYDERIVGEGREDRLARGMLCAVVVNQE
jgi:hypothetical protein